MSHSIIDVLVMYIVSIMVY